MMVILDRLDTSEAVWWVLVGDMKACVLRKQAPIEYDLLYVETLPLKDANRALHAPLNKAIAGCGVLVIEE